MSYQCQCQVSHQWSTASARSTASFSEEAANEAVRSGQAVYFVDGAAGAQGKAAAAVIRCEGGHITEATARCLASEFAGSARAEEAAIEDALSMEMRVAHRGNRRVTIFSDSRELLCQLREGRPKGGVKTHGEWRIRCSVAALEARGHDVELVHLPRCAGLVAKAVDALAKRELRDGRETAYLPCGQRAIDRGRLRAHIKGALEAKQRRELEARRETHSAVEAAAVHTGLGRNPQLAKGAARISRAQEILFCRARLNCVPGLPAMRNVARDCPFCRGERGDAWHFALRCRKLEPLRRALGGPRQGDAAFWAGQPRHTAALMEFALRSV